MIQQIREKARSANFGQCLQCLMFFFVRMAKKDNMGPVTALPGLMTDVTIFNPAPHVPHPWHRCNKVLVYVPVDNAHPLIDIGVVVYKSVGCTRGYTITDYMLVA